MKKLLIPFFVFPILAWTQTMQADFAGMLQMNSSQVTSLAEAIPADQYDWRPAEGVRSVGEAIVHICAANYILPMFSGAELPEGIDPMTMESTITGKENIMAALAKSYEFSTAWGMNLMDSQMNEEVELPFGKFNKRTILLLIAMHAHEHLGQLIAYARSNGVVPPWSQ